MSGSIAFVCLCKKADVIMATGTTNEINFVRRVVHYFRLTNCSLIQWSREWNDYSASFKNISPCTLKKYRAKIKQSKAYFMESCTRSPRQCHNDSKRFDILCFFLFIFFNDATAHRSCFIARIQLVHSIAENKLLIVPRHNHPINSNSNLNLFKKLRM